MRAVRNALLIAAALMFLGGCGPKAKIGDACKRHSQCESGICGSDMKCHSKDSDRKLRESTRKKKRGKL